MIKILAKFTNKKHPKKELGYVLAGANGNLVATNTKHMLIIETGEKIESNIGLDVNNIQADEYSKKFNMPTKTKDFNYPNYERIIKTSGKRITLNKENILFTLNFLGASTGVCVDLITYAPLFKSLKGFYVTEIVYDEPFTPIMLVGNTGEYPFKLIMMPLFRPI